MAKSDTPTRDAVLVKYLNEAYGKEKQLETALAAQVKAVKRAQLKKGLQEHLKVTKTHSKELQKRIRALGGKAEVSSLPGPEAVVEAAGAVTSAANKAVAAAKAPVQALRGTSDADRDLRSARDSYWNEAEEIAHYAAIEALAETLGDKETVKLAKAHRRDEEKMQRLLERETTALVKAVAREEIPAAERRNGGSPARRSGGSRAASRSTGSSRKGSSSRSGGSSRKSGSSTSSRSRRSSSS